MESWGSGRIEHLFVFSWSPGWLRHTRGAENPKWYESLCFIARMLSPVLLSRHGKATQGIGRRPGRTGAWQGLGSRPR